MSMNTMTATGFRARPASARAVMIGALLTMYLPGSAMADTIYTYTGEDYTVCGGIYCSGGPFALSVTFETTLTDIALANLPFTDISDTVTSFTFTDGTGLRRDNINTPPGQFESASRPMPRGQSSPGSSVRIASRRRHKCRAIG